MLQYRRVALPPSETIWRRIWRWPTKTFTLRFIMLWPIYFYFFKQRKFSFLPSPSGFVLVCEWLLSPLLFPPSSRGLAIYDRYYYCYYSRGPLLSISGLWQMKRE
ncbi:hypothetical protein, unlikely [Trypanosoma congolense IL3000]|uniref:Uncharacterized protein n=1 Tax=Trypanosoma congolense (strain IL3000) TaxID=1068625 RepID=F9WD56_TRYCI|nr:hypothetical protein, unlikely [Trypanosoma congolense IL3000]